jgi:hypothetical protein
MVINNSYQSLFIADFGAVAPAYRHHHVVLSVALSALVARATWSSTRVERGFRTDGLHFIVYQFFVSFLINWTIHLFILISPRLKKTSCVTEGPAC